MGSGPRPRGDQLEVTFPTVGNANGEREGSYPSDSGFNSRPCNQLSAVTIRHPGYHLNEIPGSMIGTSPPLKSLGGGHYNSHRQVPMPRDGTMRDNVEVTGFNLVGRAAGLGDNRSPRPTIF